MTPSEVAGSIFAVCDIRREEISMRLLQRKGRLLRLLCTGTIIVGILGPAGSTVASADQSVRVCVRKKDGEVRVLLDPNATCNSNEVLMIFGGSGGGGGTGTTGPSGPTGPTGAT